MAEDEDGNNAPERMPLPTKFVPRSHPIQSYTVRVDNTCYHRGFGPAGKRWVRGAGPYIELTIHRYVEHDDENQVIFLFEAGGREYIHRNRYDGGRWWMSNLEPPMFEVYMWSISDIMISAEWGGAISAVHFSAVLDNYYHSYGATFEVNKEEEANEDDATFDRLCVLALDNNSVLALDDDSLMRR